MSPYSDFTASQLLSIIRAMGWRLVPGRGATLHPEPVDKTARACLPKGLMLAVNERRVAIRTLLCLEDHQSGNRSFSQQTEGNTSG